MNLIIRNFWHILRKFRTTSILALLSLVAAFTVFLTVAIQCWYDFSYNRNFKDVDNIYLYTQNMYSFIGIYSKELQQMKQAYPEVDICAVLNWDNKEWLYFSVIKEDGTEERFNDNMKIGITDGFLSIFNPKTLAGDAKKLFVEPNKAIITTTYAKKLFGTENPVGKSIKMGNIARKDSEPILSIVAVWEDFPDNCSLRNGIYYDIGDDREQDGCDAVYMKIKKTKQSDLDMFIQQISLGKYFPEEQQERLRDMLNERKVILTPLKTVYFSNFGAGNLTTTLTMLFVGIIALIIAYINFMNFYIAMMTTRIKSLNIQKIFGAQTSMLRFIVASESSVFSLIAFMFAMLCVDVVHGNLSGDFFVTDFSIANNWQTMTVIGFCLLLLAFVIGLYPAYYATSFKPVLILSGSPSKSKKNVHLRNILTSVQFTVAIALIIVVVVMKWQHHYVVNYSYNMDTKNIVYLSTRNWNDDDIINLESVFAFTEELKKNPQILDIATTDNLIGTTFSPQEITINDTKVLSYTNRIGSDLFRILGVSIIEGIEFYNSVSPKQSVIVNRQFVNECGISVFDIIGKTIKFFDERTIIGVVDDINFESLHHPVRPYVFICEDIAYKFSDSWLLIKLANKDKKTIDYLKEVWGKFSTKHLELNFLDTYLVGLYKKENDLVNMLAIICTISIIIAIMGVYGLITFNIRQKEKEIALRKIAGATLKDILLLLNRGVLIQLVIAFVVAAPAAYYIANRWLETFAYKISIHWWVFVLCWLLMVAITVATICMQTYRAAIKNPIEALKTE
jgi:putative ABC transport system permease protein